MRSSASLFGLTLVGLGLLVGGGRTLTESAEPAQPAPSLKVLLEGSGLQYQTAEGGFFTVRLDLNTRVALKEVQLGTRPDGTPVIAVAVISPLMELPEGATEGTGVFDVIMSINNNTPVGWLGLAENGVIYRSAFWLRNANQEVLTAELSFLDQVKDDVRRRVVAAIEG